MLKSIYHEHQPFTLGILGGGQLAKMLAQAAYRLGLNVAIIENGKNSPAGDMTKLDFTSGWDDRKELDRFIEASDVITLENEFIEPSILDYISTKRNVFPNAATLRLVRDKLVQKRTFAAAGIPVARFEEIANIEDAVNFGANHGYPYLLKSRKFGYDGYGNATVANAEEAREAMQHFMSQEKRGELLAEAFVDFSKELAVMVARDKNGDVAVYPCVETIQVNHICHEVIAPGEINPIAANRAQAMAVACVEAIGGVGVFGIELFLTHGDELLVNEIAPRPHNSGHYTIEACYTSQYENSIRAVTGMPLGSTAMITPSAAMVNLLGNRTGEGRPANPEVVLAHKETFLHLYNKKQCRPGRKMGHITALGDTPQSAREKAAAAANALIW